MMSRGPDSKEATLNIRLSIDCFEGDKKQTAEDGTASNSPGVPLLKGRGER
jgi:hypothetical protein